MRAACVSSVLCTRVIACKAQGSERGACEDEAKPGARHAELRFVQLFTARHKTRSEHTQKANAIARSLHFYLAGIFTSVQRHLYDHSTK